MGYSCEIGECLRVVPIRYTIKNKDSVNYGKKVCRFHYQQESKNIKKTSKKTLRTNAQRTNQRKDYPDFYKKHILIAKNKICENCGKRLFGNVSEIAHILSKSLHPNLATNDKNVIYLCQDCHTEFDKSYSNRKNMKCYPKALENYNLIKENIDKHTHESLIFENL